MGDRLTQSWSEGALTSQTGEAPVQRLAKLPPARRKRLAERVGATHTDAATLADRLGRTDAALALLEHLTPPARTAARLFVEAVESLPTDVVIAEAERRLGSAEAAETALRELEREGLLVRPKWAGGAEVMALVPPLSHSCRPYLWMLGAERAPGALPVTEPATRASLGLERVRELALALAAAATDPPRLPRDGGVHAADATRLTEERFATGVSPELVAMQLGRLVDLGILTGVGARARVDWTRAEAFFELPAGARLPMLLATDVETASADGVQPPRVPGLADATNVRRLLAAALLQLPSGHWARRDALESAVRLRILASDAFAPYGDTSRAIASAESHVHASVESMLPCLEGYTNEAGETWLRLPTAEEGEPDASWLVQPTHEVMVPPEVPPSAVASLAPIVDLIRADVVATFRIGPESVARAVQAGLDADEIIDRLAMGSDHELPPTLPVQVEGWVGGGSPDLYGVLPPEPEEEVPSSREVPKHLRPAILPLPLPPASRWPVDVAEFRSRATDEAEGED